MLEKSYKKALEWFEKYYWILFALASVVLAFYCFRCLGVQYVDSWDEARHGVNAYEMMKNKDYICHTYRYRVDDWNLKPSMSYWGILLGFRLFGYNIFGFRFVSALAYLLTGISCALFAKRYSKEASILVLGFFCANTLPLSYHMARSGDADSLYVLFFTLAMLAMFGIRKKHRNIYWCGLFFALAFLTKSWHAGMIAVIGGLYLLESRELFRLKEKEWGGFLLAIFAPLVLWFGWRFTKDGFFFLKKMIEVDLLARTGTENFEGHALPFSFYYNHVFGKEGYIYRWLLLICVLGVILGLCWLWKKKAWKREILEDGLGYALWFLVPFLGFSLIQTKLIWYCYPAIVPLFLAAAIFLGKLLRAPLEREDGGTFWGAVHWVFALLVVFLMVFYMRSSYLTVIRGARGDSFQLFMKASTEREAEYAGGKAYVEVTTEKAENLGAWDQNMLFLAELYGDFYCEDGGLKAFLEEQEKAVLYIEEGRYEENQDLLREKKILCRQDGYVMLEN